MAISIARRIAYDVLWRVETESAFADALLHARLDSKIKREDAALATELTLGVLRWQRLLDFYIERRATRPITTLDPQVILALRIGLYQLRFLRIPRHAAVNESVELVKRARKRSAAALVNAALRHSDHHALEQDQLQQLSRPDLPLEERLGIAYSHPTWMVQRWLRQFGEPRTIALLESNNQPPPLCCALHHPDQRDAVIASLQQAGLVVEPGRLLRSSLVVRGGSVVSTEAYRRGWISVQDEASQAIPFLLDVHPGNSVLDLCSAPGSKTIPLARAAGPHSLVVATDRYEHRVRAMRAELQRARATPVQSFVLDGTEPLPFAIHFDRILVDAPCSGTGTLARHPEIRWRLRPEHLATFAQNQLALLSRALAHLAPGGRLVYSTCTLEPEENQEVIAALRDKTASGAAIRLVQPLEALRPQLTQGLTPKGLFDPGGHFRTFPPQHHCDGFFAGVLDRAV